MKRKPYAEDKDEAIGYIQEKSHYRATEVNEKTDPVNVTLALHKQHVEFVYKLIFPTPGSQEYTTTNSIAENLSFKDVESYGESLKHVLKSLDEILISKQATHSASHPFIRDIQKLQKFAINLLKHIEYTNNSIQVFNA